MEGEVVSEVELNPSLFGAPVNTAVLHQVVTVQLLNRRQGNASTKTRSEVSGSTKKLYRQKGTGRARQGSIRAPHRRGGGVVFGPHPHPYHATVPRKMRRIAIQSALSDKAANEQIIVLDEIIMDEPRTRVIVEMLDVLPVERNVLILVPERDENLVRSVRNIPTAKVQHISSINVIELLKHEYVIVPFEALRQLEQAFGDGSTTLPETLELAEVDEDEEAEEQETAKDAKETKETKEAKPAKSPRAAKSTKKPAAEEWEEDESSKNEEEEE
jgi:large subunit ribosomal protein L4